MDSDSQTSPLEIIPAVDVLSGGVVRLQQGDYRRVTHYGDDPVEVASGWMEEGAGRVHIVDLDGARSGETDLGLWRRLGSAGVHFQAGGGIRTAETAALVLEAGADRVVMGTAAVWNPSILSEVGHGVVAAMDVKNGRATGEGWMDSGQDVGRVADGLAAAGVRRLLVTGIGRDGTMTGPDLELTAAMIADARFSVIASGGVASLADLDPLAEMGCEAVVVGRALYEGRFTLADARRHLDHIDE